MVTTEARDLNPMSQAEIESEIRRLSRRLTGITEGLADAYTTKAEATVAYKLKHARKWLAMRGHEGTVPEKDAEALDHCAGEYDLMMLAEASCRTLEESGRNIRQQLSDLQTLAANVRSAVSHSTGEGP